MDGEVKLDPARSFGAQGVLPKQDQWVKNREGMRGKVLNRITSQLQGALVHLMNGEKKAYSQFVIYPDTPTYHEESVTDESVE